MSLNTNPDSPRQKMINLMYIVLMALLALNVSSDVLNGFSLVDESLSRTTANSTVQNQSLYDARSAVLAISLSVNTIASFTAILTLRSLFLIPANSVTL